MSRTGLFSPRRTRAVSHRPAPDTRLLLTPFPFPVLHPNTHNKRCPKAQRLRLRSDLSPSRPMQGRSQDKSRHTLPKGRCQVRAPHIGRNGFAPSGDAKEHGVMLLHRAIAPFLDSTVVTTGKLRSMNGGHGSPLPSLRVVEHFRWSRLPQSENFSRLVHTLSEVWGCDSTVVTIGKFRSTNGGHGSPLSSLRVVEHFRWTRLPQSENFSRLVHVPSEVWGCRRVDADVDRPQGRTPRIGTGVADYLRKPSGTFHRLSLPLCPDSYTVTPAPDLESTPRAESKGGVLPPLPRGERAGVRVIPSPACGVVITNQHPSHCHSDAPRGIWGGAPSPLPSTKLKGRACAAAQALPSVFPSPSPLKALRERGIKGERVPYPPSAPREIPRKPFRRRSIKPATNSINVQSMFNQNPNPTTGSAASLSDEKGPRIAARTPGSI